MTQIQHLEDRIKVLEEENRRYVNALADIIDWSNAYHIDLFPEPDFKKARSVLRDAGMTLDSISASAMRHVITGVADIAKKALETKEVE